MHQGDVQNNTCDIDVEVHGRIGGHCPSTKGDKIAFISAAFQGRHDFVDAVTPDSQARPDSSQAFESCAEV